VEERPIDIYAWLESHSGLHPYTSTLEANTSSTSKRWYWSNSQM